MVDISTWINTFLKALDETFGDRVWFVGLQGSYGRGEATETSDIDIVVMGSDWAGSDKFKYLEDYCEVIYLERTEGISTTKIKKELLLQEPINGINQIPVSGIEEIKS